MNERLIKDINFIVELDKMKSIYRRTEVINERKKEDDAQHSWHIAIMAMVLHEYSDEKIDLLKTIKMLLIHDSVEIY
ncbi:MAG TPA: HD domain-containing protein, partial [Soehngenia sp.]|nr:HD domain-containing protein [Soehngenia sp.]